MPYFCKNFSSAHAGQIFKSHQQNYFIIFPKILPRDNKGSSNIQVTWLNPGYFC